MTRTALRTSFKVKRFKGQGHRPTNADSQNVPYLSNGKAHALQSWYADGGHRPASAASAVTSKVKGQGHKLASSVRVISASS